MTYKYVDPLTQGYKQVKITRKQHRELFSDKLHWTTKVEYYIRSDSLLVHKTTNWVGWAIMTLLIPYLIAYEGIQGWEDSKRSLKQFYREKKFGKHTEHKIWQSSTSYKIFKKLMTEVRPKG